MIGNAKEFNHLYLFEDESARNSEALTVHNDVNVSPSIQNTVMLWHFRLGHLSFSYMFKLFPSLFHDKKPSFFFNVKFFNCLSIIALFFLLIIIKHLILFILFIVTSGTILCYKSYWSKMVRYFY